MITWIYGHAGVGKTTLAKKLGGLLLDGDDMRRCWKLGFSEEDRREHNLRIAKIAFVLENQGFEVVVATMCPYESLRKEISQLGKVKWIHIEGGETIKNEDYAAVL